MATLADWVIAKRKFLLIGMGSIAILLIALVPRNELNDVFVDYFDERIEFRTETDFIVKNLTGLYFVDYSSNYRYTEDIVSQRDAGLREES